MIQNTVTLCNSTFEPLRKIAFACAVCTDTRDKWLESTAQEREEVSLKALESGHLSVAEHVIFSFFINGISRACSHQIVRYRHCSFSQLSQRYVKVGTKEECDFALSRYRNGLFDVAFHRAKKYFVFPEEVDKEDEFLKMVLESWARYHELIDKGWKAENARAVLPNCTKTSILITLNLRELIHLANERLCSRAQGEIRGVVQKMCELVIEDTPSLAQFLVPKCELYGRCFEKKSCGRK